MTKSVDVRARLVETLRRDLIGPGPQDADIRDERLKENPSRWYLAGYLAPAPDGAGEEVDEMEEDGDPLFGADEGADPETGRARAADDPPPDEPAARKVRAPSSCGLTVLIDASVKEIEVALSWGDYVTIPPLPEAVFVDAEGAVRSGLPDRPMAAHSRRGDDPPPGARERTRPARSSRRILPAGSGRAARWSSRRTRGPTRSNCPTARNGTSRALTVTVVNRRKATQRRFADVTFAFQVRLEARCASGFFPRSDMTGFGSRDPDAALADLHYADVAEYAIGCNASAGWTADADGVVRTAYTDFLPDRRSRARRAERGDHGRRVRNGGPRRPRRDPARTLSPTRSRTCRCSMRPGSQARRRGSRPSPARRDRRRRSA